MEEYKTFTFKKDYTELVEQYNYSTKVLSNNKNKINFIITHYPCTDGFMSATVVHIWLKEQGINLDNVVFYNASHGSDFSDLLNKIKDKYVLICDFSFPKNLFEKMIDVTNGNILILDHHKTSKKKLEDIDEKYYLFDMNHSGAFITWTYFFGFDNIPKAILYVEDNDCWYKKLPLTQEFTSYIFTKEFNFTEYEKFFNDEYLITNVFPIGKGMVLQNNMYIDNFCKKAIPHFMEIKGRYYFVVCHNSSGILKSELGNAVLKKYMNANFSMIYSHDVYRDSTTVSYRSTDSHSDCSLIAKITGGGGHRNAAGTFFTNIVSKPPGRLIDKYRAYWLLENLYVLEFNEKKFIMLNCPNLQIHMVNYLMQERYYDDEANLRNIKRYEKKLPGYQEGMFCMRNKYKNSIIDFDIDTFDEYYHGALLWTYNGESYKMTGKFLSELYENINNNIISYNLDKTDKLKIKIYQKNNNIYVFEFDGSYNIDNIISIITK